jgi:serine phosphatase RsbU (regulator of sigma subunit)
MNDKDHHLLKQIKFEKDITLNDESLIKKILDSIDYEITIIDKSYTIKFLNKKRIDKHGSNLIGLKCYDVFPNKKSNKKGPCRGCPCKPVLSGKESSGTYRLHKLIDKNGYEYNISEKSSPIFDKNGSIKYAINIIEDISDQVNLENKKRKIDEAKEKLQNLQSYDEMVKTIVDTLKKCGFSRIRYYDVNYDSNTRKSYFIGRYSAGMNKFPFKGYKFKGNEGRNTIAQWKGKKPEIISSRTQIRKNISTKFIKDLGLENEKWIPVPIIIGDDLIGLVSVDNKGSKNTLTNKDIIFLRDFLRYFTQVITNSRIISNLKILNRINSEIAKITDQNQLLKILTKEICFGLDASQCAIFLYNKKTKKLNRSQIFISDLSEDFYNNIPEESYEMNISMTDLMYSEEIINITDFDECDEIIKRKVNWCAIREFEKKISEVTHKKIKFNSAIFTPLIIDGEYIGLVRIIYNRSNSNVPFPKFDRQFIQSINHQIAIVLKKTQLLNEIIASKNIAVKLNKELEADLNMARDIQMSFISNHSLHFPQNTTFDESAIQFYYRYLPAATLAGDFFHILPVSDHKVAILICDVMGHGVRASLLTTYLYGLIGELKPISDNPAALMNKLNVVINKVMTHSRIGIFATAFYLVADIKNGLIQYTNAGHPPPFIIHEVPGHTEMLLTNSNETDPALGLLKEYNYSVTESAMCDNDRFLFFTDGIYEVENGKGQIFGRQKLFDSVQKYMNNYPDKLLNKLLLEIHGYTKSYDFKDDVCMIIMHNRRSITN